MGSSQYLYNAKMREEIVEQLGVTPTPGGLELLLRQSENNRMAHGGIVHLAGGGYQSTDPWSPNFRLSGPASTTSLTSRRNPQLRSALGDFGQILKGIAPDAIFSGMTGGLGPLIKRVAGSIWNKFGGQGIGGRLIEQMTSSGASPEQIQEIRDMSTHEFQKMVEGWAVPGERENEETGETETTGRLAGQDMSANRSTAQALMAMPTYAAMYNVGGSGGHGKGAGGNFGQGQRMIRKEQKKIKQRANKYDQFGDESWYLSEGYEPEQANYYANTFKNMYGSGQDLIDTMHDRGFGRGAYEAFDRVAESPPESAADSRGRPQNWSEIFSNYQETGSFDESPEAQWGGG